MHWIDWLITIVPVVIVLGMAVYSRKYVRGVVDYLAAGRVAGRYVIAVGSLESSLGIISLVAMVEATYQTGFALGFWGTMMAPLGVIMSLTGYCVYRFRETKALSIGQFLEMRYNRSFRIFAASLRTLAEMLTNSIGPAIAANFFIYFIGFPHHVLLWGISIPTFAIIVAVILAMAMIVMWPGGRLSLLITDCVQGLISYPIFVIIVGYILYHFSWSQEIAPVMMDRAAGESFLNPFDIEKLRDFNMFALMVGVISSILNRASWIGNDATNSGRTPHEQKMAGILGAWRNGFSGLMCLMITIVVITFLSHEKFATQAKDVRLELADKVAKEMVPNADTRTLLHTRLVAIPEQHHQIGVDKPLSRKDNLDTPYLDVARQTLGSDGDGNFAFQKFRALYNQMMMPLALRQMLPVGLTGIFCLLMVMLMLATDDSRIFNSSSTLIQDIVMPLRKTPLAPKQHLHWLRMGSLAVCVFFFVCSLFFVSLDYIAMFLTIMTSVWLGGAGPVMIFGLYSRFGNTTGAFSSLFIGSGISVGGLLLQRNWAQIVYPFIERMGWTRALDGFLQAVTSPTSPYVVWRMDPVTFPINSCEIMFIAMAAGILAYIAGSLLTYTQPYNLERMLHRGQYNIDGEKPAETKWSWHWKVILDKLIGITPEFTFGDKVLTWSVFLYTFVFQIGICFVAVLVWNLFSPWPIQWWSHYFYINSLVISAIIGIISTVWFLIGGIIDTKRLIKDLEARVDNPLDDGRVKGHVSLMDVDKLGSDPEDNK